MCCKTVLSLGSGRLWEDVSKGMQQRFPDDPNLLVLHVDQMYTSDDLDKFIMDDIASYLYNDNIFEFLESYTSKDISFISAIRVFEHIPRDKIAYLLYLLKEVSTKDAQIEIIVPDFNKVFEKLKHLDEELLNDLETPSVMEDLVTSFEKDMIDLHTEIFNEPNDPHQSIWTIGLARYYFDIEKYWKIEKLNHVEIDGRNWYLKIVAKKNVNRGIQ